MSTKVIFTGIEETKAEFKAQPEALAKATQTLANRIAKQAVADIKAAYPRKTGNLRNGVKVERSRNPSKTIAAARVVNRAPHAHLYELGTKARHFVGTDKRGRKYVIGDRGQGTAHHVFPPRIVRWRFVFFEAVKEIMNRAGITTTGEAVPFG